MYKTFKLHDHDLKFHTKDITKNKKQRQNTYTPQGLRYFQKAS